MSEHHRVASFQANDFLAFPGSLEQQAINVVLFCMVATATLSDVIFLCIQCLKKVFSYQVVVEDDVGILQCLDSLDSQQFRVSGTEAHKCHLSLTMQNILALEDCLQFFPTPQSSDSQIPLQRMCLEGQHLADVILHS